MWEENFNSKQMESECLKHYLTQAEHYLWVSVDCPTNDAAAHTEWSNLAPRINLETAN